MPRLLDRFAALAKTVCPPLRFCERSEAIQCNPVEIPPKHMDKWTKTAKQAALKRKRKTLPSFLLWKSQENT